MPATDTKTKLDTRILVSVAPRKWDDDPTYDITAYPVYIVVEDGRERIRNFTDHGVRDEHPEYHDLQFSAYYTPGSDQEIWGWRMSYRNVFSVELDDAERMVKTLRKLHKGYDKLTKQFGYPETYPAWLARMGTLLGVTQYGFRASGEEGWYDGNEYRWTEADNLAGYLDHQIRKAVKKP